MLKKKIAFGTVVFLLLMTAIVYGGISTGTGTDLYLEEDIRGSGTAEDPFVIASFRGLELLGNEEEGYPLDAYYQLGNDIDASLTQDEDYNKGQGWQPVGAFDLDSTPRGATNQPSEYIIGGFAGVFDGAGYEISGLYVKQVEPIVDASDDYPGFFHALNGGIVKNLGLVDAQFEGQDNLGALVSYNLGSIKNSYVEGEVVGNEFFGGLVGINLGEIERSHFKGEIQGQSFVGGLANYNAGVIEQSYVKGSIKADKEVAGLVQYNVGRVERSAVKGLTIEATAGVAGLVTVNEGGEIINSYAQASISGESNLAGLVVVNGYNMDLSREGLVKNSYAAVKVSADQDLGGLVNFEDELPGLGSAIVENSYWDVELFGQSQSFGGEAKSTEEMQRQSSYQGWDFDNVWSIDDGYPDLQLKK